MVKFLSNKLIPTSWYGSIIAYTGLICICLLSVLSSVPAFANVGSIEVQIQQVYDGTCPNNPTKTCVVADVVHADTITKGVVLREGSVRDRTYEVYKAGDIIYVTETVINGDTIYNYLRPKRNSPLVLLVGLFLVVILFIGGSKGWRSLISLVVSTVLVFNVMLPLFVQYPDYVLLIGILVSFLIYSMNQVIGHGFRTQSYISILGGGISFIIVLIISLLSARAFLISGFGDEGAMFIYQLLPANFRLGDLFIIGILFGLTGAVDDVNATQTSSIAELVEVNPVITPYELYTKGMKIGTSHMVSIINTLFLAYIGAALPTMILFSLLDEGVLDIIGREDIIEEIIRTVVASIGLLFAIPLTTWLSVYFLSNKTIYSQRQRFLSFLMTK